jgi:hypothetical protein
LERPVEVDVDEIIRRAMDEGRFDHLEGAGKPLNLAAKGRTDVAFGILKDAGFCPPWMALAREIDADLAELDRTKQSLIARYDAAVRAVASSPATAAQPALLRAVNEARAAAICAIASALARINANIASFNLQVPLSRSQRALVPARARLCRLAERCPALAVQLDGQGTPALVRDARLQDVDAALGRPLREGCAKRRRGRVAAEAIARHLQSLRQRRL